MLCQKAVLLVGTFHHQFNLDGDFKSRLFFSNSVVEVALVSGGGQIVTH